MHRSGPLIGLLSAGVAVAVGELVAAFVRPEASPIIAVGNRFVIFTPEPLKHWAISTFGTNDKSALLTGIYLVIALAAALVGALAVRRPRAGLVAFSALGVLGGYCALTAHAHHTADVVPTIVGTVAGATALLWLVRGAQRHDATDPAGRRRFLLGGAAVGGLALVGGLGGRALQHRRYDANPARAAVALPAPVDAAAGLANGTDLGKSGVPFVTPSADFYRIDTALTVPQLDPQRWRLRIHGRVEQELTLSFADLMGRPLIERFITLACVSNPVGGDLISTGRFLGVRLADVLREAGVHADADQLIATSADGMTIGSPTAVIMDGRDAMLAVGMNGAPLPLEHGFPVRMVVPGLFGYVSACKWIVDLEATTFGATAPYWVARGWAARGPVLLSSRIDRPHGDEVVRVGDTVAIAGVAWDQHVGVSAVEVRVDDGPWTLARLAPVPSTDTWRQWVFPWTVGDPGRHALQVRATDARGRRQDEATRDTYPSGATGLHRITVAAR